MKARFKAMKKGLKLTDEDISRITGNTANSIQVTTSRKGFPRWAKLAVWVYEYFTGDSLEKIKDDKTGELIDRAGNLLVHGVYDEPKQPKN